MVTMKQARAEFANRTRVTMAVKGEMVTVKERQPMGASFRTWARQRYVGQHDLSAKLARIVGGAP